jgi:glycosyltransferase involved in cell wall biosynthesis
MPWRLQHVCPTVVTFHDLRVPYLFPKAGRLRETAVNFMAKQASGVIATNPQDLTALQLIGVEAERLTQIPIGSNINARDVLLAEITAVRHELGLAETDQLLGYFGFLNETKGADTLLQALAELPSHVHLVFIGGRTGTSDTANNQIFYDLLDDMILHLGLSERVHWTGFVPEYNVSVYLKTADLMVMPYRDGVSLRRGTLMAVLAHGRPLITTTPTTPTPELTHGENVWLVPPNNPESLAIAIKTVLADKNLQTKLANGGDSLAEYFSWNKIAEQTAKFLQRMKDEG